MPGSLLVSALKSESHPAHSQRHFKKFQSLQVFRGLAALSVVAFHAAVLYRERTNISAMVAAIPGCSGVDFFFVLSGFIIFTVHRRDFGHPGALKEYLRRRFVRVYPLYFILSVVLVIAYALHFGHYAKLNAAVVLKSIFLLPQSPGDHPIINVSWTLTHEALFYMIVGALICLSKAGRVILLTAMLALTTYNCALPMNGPYWLHTWLFSPYNFEFSLGCIAAMVARRRVGWALPLGLAALAVIWAYASNYPVALGDSDALLRTVFFGIPYFLIVAGSASIEFNRVIKPPNFLVRLGDATYSIYLAHFAVASALTALLYKLPLPPLFIITAVLSLSIFAGFAVYIWLEQPLLKMMKKESN